MRACVCVCVCVFPSGRYLMCIARDEDFNISFWVCGFACLCLCACVNLCACVFVYTGELDGTAIETSITGRVYIYINFAPFFFLPHLCIFHHPKFLCRVAYSSADFCKYFAENLPDYRKYIYTYICIYTHTYIYIYIYVKHSVFFWQTVLTGFARLLSNFEFSRTR